MALKHLLSLLDELVAEGKVTAAERMVSGLYDPNGNITLTVCGDADVRDALLVAALQSEPAEPEPTPHAKATVAAKSASKTATKTAAKKK